MLFYVTKILQIFASIILLASNVTNQTKQIILPKADVIHSASGLILSYMGEFKPSNAIVAFSVTIPMIPDACYLIPITHMKKIPHCLQQLHRSNNTETREQKQTKDRPPNQSNLITRRKRLIADIIAIGIGSAALPLSTVNAVQIANLRSEVGKITNSLNNLEQISNAQSAQMFHLSEGQFKLANELNYTQAALNKTIDLVNEHSEILKTHENALKTLSSITMYLNDRLSSFMHAVETHFIHTAIENILANKLNLQFIHHRDLANAINSITQLMNISFEDTSTTLSPIELISRLLVQQRVDFIPNNAPTNNSDNTIIGSLVFSSFLAAPDKNQRPFTLYELTAVPFNQGKNRVSLAQLPHVIGIEQNSLQFIRWTKSEAESCTFNIMSSCRETPAIRNDLIDSCLYQILTDIPLHSCHIEPANEPIFIQRIGQHWITSTNTTTKCHSSQFLNSNQHKIISNKEIILPPVALISITESTSLSCDHFILPGLPTQLGKTISILENSTINYVNNDIIDLQEKIMNNTHWAKLPYIPPNMKAIIEFLANTPTTPTLLVSSSPKMSIVSSITIIVFILTIGITILFCYYIRSYNSQASKLTIMLPLTKTTDHHNINI